MVFTKASGRTDSRTHSRTDRPECSIPPAPFFNGGGSTKIQITNVNKYATWQTGKWQNSFTGDRRIQTYIGNTTV